MRAGQSKQCYVRLFMVEFFHIVFEVNFSLKAINYLVIAKLTPFLHAFGIIFWLSRHFKNALPFATWKKWENYNGQPIWDRKLKTGIVVRNL